MQDIVDVLGEAGVTPDIIRLVDIGAMSCGAADPWGRLVDRGQAHLLGFEPQKDECARCNAMTGPGYRYLPEALGDGTTRPFHRCRSAPNSSFYTPNVEVLGRFEGLLELMEIVDTTSIATRRLDDIEEARSTDFLKLDVQGAELDILGHATETLGHVGLIQTEVCFMQLYENQPLFADIDDFLRVRGFELYTFWGFGTRMQEPLSGTDIPRSYCKQVLWSDAVYLKRFDLASKD
ncbi:MAG: FkbM family methyltransferase, partial [Geminicoccaceae bacterium]